jgi:hypothetical protein
MSSTTAIDFETIEAQVRADAERKVTVLREIVDTHTELTRDRDAFLVEDAERVRRLSALIAEAKAAGFDQKTLAPFQAEPLATKRPAARKRTPAPTRRAASAQPTTSDRNPSATPAETATVESINGETGV